MSKKAQGRRSRRQIVRVFDENAQASADRLGGKGFSLVEMVRLGVPVPPGFTVSTTVARYFRESGRLPKRLVSQLARGIRAVERKTGRKFGDAKNPLLLSVRSGAPVSMPGMMDTVLNLGLTPKTVQGLARQSGDPKFAWDCYRRFLVMYGTVVVGLEREVFTEPYMTDLESLRLMCGLFYQTITEHCDHDLHDVHEMLSRTMIAVLQSWNSPRAQLYRQTNGIAHWLGTAVNVQAMVFGNAGDDSCTGVVFSRDVSTGEPRLYGEFLPNAQGEDVVAGIRTPQTISEMGEWNSALYDELRHYVELLEERFSTVVDVEFTVERGRLFILQVRKAQMSIEAQVTYLVHRVWDRKARREDVLNLNLLQQLTRQSANRFSDWWLKHAAEFGLLLAEGLPASAGAVCGKLVFTSKEAIHLAGEGETVVLFRPETSPEDLEGILAASAVVTARGGKTSHAAVVTRSLNKPCVVGIGCDLSDVSGTVSVCGHTGKVFRNPIPLEKRTLKKELNIYRRWMTRFYFSDMPRAALEKRHESFNVNTACNDFYLVDAMAEAAKGELSKQAMELRQRLHQLIAERMAAYIMVATGGELRHTGKSGPGSDWPAFKTLRMTFGVSSSDRTMRSDAHEAVARVLERMDVSDQLRYLNLAVDTFGTSWSDSIYGGKKWGAIARAPIAWLEGRIDTTAFVDHSFDLFHNGGRMFGKHSNLMVGNTRELGLQLDAKRDSIGGPSKLREGLQCWHRVFSPEVEALYRRGQQMNQW